VAPSLPCERVLFPGIQSLQERVNIVYGFLGLRTYSSSAVVNKLVTHSLQPDSLQLQGQPAHPMRPLGDRAKYGPNATGRRRFPNCTQLFACRYIHDRDPQVAPASPSPSPEPPTREDCLCLHPGRVRHHFTGSGRPTPPASARHLHHQRNLSSIKRGAPPL